uniref:Uncharacterized protein n=1 Tax=Anguilla anguilla TaxID=7936 RepID=A0A0E9TDP5_ANGAN
MLTCTESALLFPSTLLIKLHTLYQSVTALYTHFPD